ncbi:MAG: toxin-antitoxin system, toxin component, partial [Eubacterium sp.]|nr:toxin-antitoxin system, toxin component [Eubacterium sp.]
DIDIAILVKGGREESQRYQNELVSVSSDIDLKNEVVVNYICLPYDEFIDRKSYYPFYSNIENEGVVLYG